jgi:hypothetical protein
MCVKLIKESTAIGENSNFAEYSPLFILFLPYLTTLSQYLRLYSLEWKGDKWWWIGKDVAGKRSWPNFKVLSRHFPGGIEKNHEHFSLGLDGLHPEIWTRHLPSTKQEC